MRKTCMAAWVLVCGLVLGQLQPFALTAMARDGSPTPESTAAAQQTSEDGTAGNGDLFAEDEVVATVAPYEVQPDLSNIVNISDYYLPDQGIEMLAKNGFYVQLDSYDREFFDQYELNRYNMMPNFVTVDSMMHTYHLYFSYLMKKTERNYLSQDIKDLTTQMLASTLTQLDALRGTEWESAAVRDAAFFAVGASLLGLPAEVPEDVKAIVDGELAKIMAASEITECALTPAQMEDYTQYIPRGYYAGDAAMESYFRAMMWYGRISFTQKNEDLDRSGLLITLAMKEESLALWDEIYTITSFFAGSSDDNGYYDYRPLIDEAYGENVTVADLVGKDAEWKKFHELTAQLPAPTINSVPVMDEGMDVDHVAANLSFRFMGQRASLDAAAFQMLVYNKVGQNENGENRMMPNALDIPAALGSDAALAILEAKGETAYAGYLDNMTKIRLSLASQPEEFWTASLYSEWLYTLSPALAVRGEGYPMFMQTEAWVKKNLNTFLGSYTELKHDTVLYSKQIMVEMGGGDLPERDDRGYVEPEPILYRRLAALSAQTSADLAEAGVLDEEDAQNLEILKGLALQLETISRKELVEETLTDEEYDLIRGYGGQIEHFWQRVYRDEATSEYITSKEFPAAIVTDIATDPNGQCLEIGTGEVATIYVVVPIEGELHLTTGTVYTFYQFTMPVEQRLTDSAWRIMMGIEIGEDGQYKEPQLETEDWISDYAFNAWR